MLLTRYKPLCLRALLASTALAVTPQMAHAQAWDGSEGSDWKVAGNWSGGVVPTAAGQVIIDTSVNNPVQLSSGTETASTLIVGQTGVASLTVSNGAQLAVTNTSATTFSPVFTLTVGGAGTNGGTAQRLAGTANGTLTVTGAGSRVTTPVLYLGQGANTTTGSKARGTAVVDNGATLVTSVLASLGYVGPGSGGGTLTVTGPGTVWEATGSVAVLGDNSQITISNGATVRRSGNTSWDIRQPAGVRITGAGTTADLGSVNIASGDATRAGLLIENGAVVNALAVNSASSTNLGPDSGAIGISGGSTLNASSILLGFSTSKGHVSVVDSTLNLTGGLRIGDGRFTTVASTTLLKNANLSAGAIDLADGILAIGGFRGDAAGGAGTLTAATLNIASDTDVTSELVLNHTGNDFTIASLISGSGIIRHVAGDTILSGNSNFFAGSTLVTGGTLSVNGALGGATHSMTLSGGAALGGSGRIGGTVTVADGTVAPGNSPGTLAFANNLALGSASILNFELGSPTGTAGVASDLITVARNLTLDGTLNVTNVGGFGGGLYRLINYGGTLTNNGLDIGLTPAGFAAGDLTVQTATAGQVNLLVAAAAPTSFTFWDGAGTGADNIISGGTGTWDATRTNWTVSDGKFNGAYDRAGMLIFGAEAQSGGVLTTIGGPRAAAAPLLDRRFTVTVDAGQGAIAIANGATLSGTAGMQFAANGYLLTGADLVLGGFTTVRVGDGTTAGAGFIAEIANNITGAGLLWKDDLGTLILSGTNSHTGGTRVRKGTLMGDTDSLQGRVDVDGALIINQVQNGRFAGQLFGEGTLAKEGAGTLTYDVTDVAETFEGPITINAGRFIIGGNTLGGSVTVNNTATLGGTARGLGSLFVRSGGTLAPGNSIGQLMVSSATFDAGSIFQVELNDGGSVPGVNNDLLLVDGGDVRINGGTVHVSPANGTDTGATYASGTRYRIISTDDGGEVTGTFDTLTDDFAFLNFTLSYGNEDVFLTSALAKTTFCLGGMTFNQCSTGEGAFSIGSGAVFDALLNLTDAEAPVALDALSGEVHASARTMLLEDSRFPREAVLARLGSADSGAGAWGHAFGSRGHWDSDGNAGRADRDIDGFFTGIDAPLGQNARAGLMGGYTHTKVEIGSRGSTGSVDSWHLGAYGGGQWGGLGVRLGGAVAWHNLATTRAIAFRGFTDAATDSYDVRTGQLFAEAAYRVEVRDLVLEPFAQVAWVNLTSSDYAEQGGAAALSGGNDSLDASFSTIGLRGETVLGGKLRLTGSGAWRHAFSALAERTPFTTHAFAGSDDFTIAGLPVARNALAVDAGLVLDLSDNARLSATYSGQAGSSLSDHGGKVGLSIRF